MKKSVTSALLVSICFISLAIWYRFGNQSTRVVNELIAVNQGGVKTTTYEDIFGTTGTNSTTTNSKLNTSDKVSRQFMLDYLSLAQNGQDTTSNLGDLVTKYVDSIPTLISSRVAYLTDLKITTNSIESLRIYSAAFNLAYNAYLKELSSSYPETSTYNTNAIASMSKAYENLSNKLIGMAVPSELSQYHLELINIALSNVDATRAMTRSNLDPTTAFAGLISLRENSGQEEAVVEKIKSGLSKYGI